MKNPCIDATRVNIVEAQSLAQISYRVGDDAITIDYPLLSDYSHDLSSLCGDLSVTLDETTQDASIANYITNVDDTAQTVTFEILEYKSSSTSDSRLRSRLLQDTETPLETVNLVFNVSLIDYPQTYYEVTQEIVVYACQIDETDF